MKQKTAMMELVNYMKANFHLTDESLEKFDELLEKEKEQIMEAFWTGENFSSDYYYTDLNKTVTNENYYNETYKQDKRECFECGEELNREELFCQFCRRQD